MAVSMVDLTAESLAAPTAAAMVDWTVVSMAVTMVVDSAVEKVAM